MGLIKEEYIESKKYDLDIENNDYGTITKITRENVAKIEFILRIDSDYKDSINESKKRTNSYNGSSAYWFKQLKELIDTGNDISIENYSYEQIIEGIIIAVDNENSTHLNSDKMGRITVKNRILSLSRDELIRLLKNPNKSYDLINLIATPVEEGERNHLSFASKFCRYTSRYLFKDTSDEDYYAIYDSVVVKSLPKYIKRYLNEDVNPKEYKNDYNKFSNYIDRIIDKAAKEHGIKISRNGFDHLVWYYHKGRQ